MSKFVKTQYNSGKEILKLSEYTAIPVTVDDTGVTADTNGKKIVPAGTIVGGGRLADPSKKVSKKNDTNAEGVLLYDVDVTYGPKEGSMVIHGFIDRTKLPEAPATAAITALNMIKFVG